ncbi:MAG: protein kinase [Patescibacteria group bacterium]|nr:protein kinase [Patescibacteria group bacterium]
MSDIKTTVLRKVISAAVGLEGPAMWQAIDRAADTIEGDDGAKKYAIEVAAYAHLACFSGDGRHLIPAVRQFCKLKRFDVLKDLLEIARAFGETKAVQEIRRIGLYTGIESLSVPDFAEWFMRCGVRWFDVYRDEQAGVSFVDPKDVAALKILVAQEYPDQTKFWDEVVRAADEDPHYPQVRRELLHAIAEGREFVVPTPPNRRDEVDSLFRRYADENGIRILRQLAQGKDGLTRCSNIYLALDSDGIIKVFKEVLTHEEERIGANLDEEANLFPLITDIADVPSHYGEFKLADGTEFMIRSYVYGQSLADYVHPGQLLDKDAACAVVGAIAETLASLHCRPGLRGILYLDLRPDNVMVSHEGVSLFDFNASRREPDVDDGSEVVSYILDPKFAPPEVTLHCKASTASDIFQLGLLFHQLLYGRLPFVTCDELEHKGEHREQAVLKFSLANALMPYEHHPEIDFADERLTLIREMLAKDPRGRPDANEVADALFPETEAPKNLKLTRRAAKNRREKNTVLFPARMGIPHYGHIDYISRLLDLGYHVKISLQRSYTITERDPLPKWIVMKMVARSLLARGYDPASFSFMLTPYFGTDELHRLHFAMMPGYEDVVAVASSNVTIRDIFPGLMILDQKSVFGTPNEEYEVRSWGQTLRDAIKREDEHASRLYAAEGVEQIMTFREIRERYAETPVEFLPGKVVASVAGADWTPLDVRVRKYDLPEEVIALTLGATIVQPYERETPLRLRDGRRRRLRYERMSFTDGDETIFFRLVPE